MMEFIKPSTTSASAVNMASAETTSANSELSELKNQISDLTKAVNEIKFSRESDRNRSFRNRSRARGSTPSRNFRRFSPSPSPNRRRGRYNPNGPLCYYHFQFRQHATRCSQPCSWSSETQPSSSRPGNASRPNWERNGSG